MLKLLNFGEFKFVDWQFCKIWRELFCRYSQNPRNFLPADQFAKKFFCENIFSQKFIPLRYFCRGDRRAKIVQRKITKTSPFVFSVSVNKGITLVDREHHESLILILWATIPINSVGLVPKWTVINKTIRNHFTVKCYICKTLH